MTFMVRWHGAKASADVRRAAKPAVRRAGEFVLEQANRTIPHETGHMQGTGKVTQIDDLAVAISYDTPYVVRQHEDTRLRHDPGRRAKWLERTLQEERQRVQQWIADEIRKAL